MPPVELNSDGKQSSKNSVAPAQHAAQQSIQIASIQCQQLARSGQQGRNLIVSNRNPSPQDVMSAQGTDAAAVCELVALNVGTVNAAATIGGTTVRNRLSSSPSNYVAAFNEDGSATVTQAGSSSSSSSSEQ